MYQICDHGKQDGEPCAVCAEIVRQREDASPPCYLSVPRVPEPACIDSMCLRYDHGFSLKRWNIGQGREESDEEFERRRDSIRSTMRQLYEEATGQGFFKR
jgi:hypothetical protein